MTGPVLQNKKIKFGQFVNQKLEGAGIEIDEKGGYFIGTWVNDLKNGPGRKIFYDDGEIYEGDWVDNKPQGKGLRIYANGA